MAHGPRERSPGISYRTVRRVRESDLCEDRTSESKGTWSLEDGGLWDASWRRELREDPLRSAWMEEAMAFQQGTL
jgi:hypothetical protein